MKIRELRESDIPLIQQWHRERNLQYPLPDLLADNVVRAEIVVDERDQPMQLLFGVKTVEIYLLSDPNWGTPRRRLLALRLGHETLRKWLCERGWPDVFAVIPPEFKRFGQRLAALFGWQHGSWQHYSRKTAGDAKRGEK